MFPGATLPLFLDGRPKRQMHETLVVPEAIQHHVSAATTFGVQHTAHRKVPGEWPHQFAAEKAQVGGDWALSGQRQGSGHDQQQFVGGKLKVL